MSLPEYEFLDKTEDLECPICTLVLTAPVQTRCCGALFCKSCIEQWSPISTEGGRQMRRASKSSCCPNCRTSPLQYFDDKRTERMIKNLTVTCSNHKSGCKWTGEFRNLSDHLTSANASACEYQVIPCPRKCGENVLRSCLFKHSQNDCLHRKVRCQFCQMTGDYKVIIGSHYDACPQVKIQCPNNCTAANLLRSQLQEHLKECPLEIISCDFANAGCTQRMARKDIEVHRITGISQHLCLVNKKFAQVLEHLECRDHIAPVVMKMSNFTQQENWSSPCFYTHPNGYKLQLKVLKHMFNSLFAIDTDVNAGFLSASIVLIDGPFDEHLSWPMCARVSVRLLNQAQDSKHHSVTFQIEQQRHGTIPHSSGQFFACNKLNNQRDPLVQYLVSDSLYFQVFVELLGDCKPKSWLNQNLVLI